MSMKIQKYPYKAIEHGYAALNHQPVAEVLLLFVPLENFHIMDSCGSVMD